MPSISLKEQSEPLLATTTQTERTVKGVTLQKSQLKGLCTTDISVFNLNPESYHRVAGHLTERKGGPRRDKNISLSLDKAGGRAHV